MLRLTREHGTTLKMTVKPSTETREITVHFWGSSIGITAPHSIEVLRDDAINKEKSCTGSTVSGS